MSLPEAANVWAILVAGGTGSRFDAKQSKLLWPLAGQPVLAWSARALAEALPLSGLVVVTHQQWTSQYEQVLFSLNLSCPLGVVAGGDTRRQSVWHGLQAVPQAAQVVLVHDAARPLARLQRIREVVAPILSGEAMGTTLGVPVQDTIKQVTPGEAVPWISRTLPREQLWQVHTPQAFRADVLRTAHQQVPAQQPVTDDIQLLELCFGPEARVRMVMDDPENLKITTLQDARVAADVLSQRMAVVTP